MTVTPRLHARRPARRTAPSPFLPAALDPATARTIRAAGREETLPRGAVLWHDEMEPPQGVVLEGILRHQRFGIDGHRQIVNLIVPGEMLDLSGVGRRGYTLEAATPVSFLRLRPADLERLLAEEPAVAAFAFWSLQRQLDRLRWLTWTILDLGVEARLCAFIECALTALPVKTGPDGLPILTLVLPRRDIADLLSTSVETVCRILKGLEREGLIRMCAPTQLQIRDIERLRARGQSGTECPLSLPGQRIALPGEERAAATGGQGR